MKYGNGSLFQRRSDGRWIGRITDARGVPHHVTGTDRDTVRKRLSDLRRTLTPSPSRRRGGERVDAYLDRWLAEVAPMRGRPRTLEGHAQRIRDHLVPALGRLRLRDLEPADVQVLVASMMQSYAPQTVHNAVRTLSVALAHAERSGDVDRNVARLVVLPARPRETPPALDVPELRSFLAATKDHPHWPIWALAFATGMRIGEVLGLRWQDVNISGIGPRERDSNPRPPGYRVDMGAGALATELPRRPYAENTASVHVEGTYRRIQVGDTVEWRRQPPKTAKSRREVILPALGVEALRVQKARATSAIVVFARSDGQPLDRSYVSRQFSAALAAAGVRHVRFHSLRHSAAIAMLDNLGGDLRAASAQLGHSNLGITSDLYGGTADDARRRAAAAMDAALGTDYSVTKSG